MIPSIDDWGLNLAAVMAQRGDCDRSQVGAVAIDIGGDVVGFGFNGAPKNDLQCMTDGACPRAFSNVEPGSSYDTGAGACIALHAEQRLIMKADWKELLGATLYVTREPCDGCWRMIKEAHIARVIWRGVRPESAAPTVREVVPDEAEVEVRTLGGRRWTRPVRGDNREWTEL